MNRPKNVGEWLYKSDVNNWLDYLADNLEEINQRLIRIEEQFGSEKEKK